MSDPVLCTLAKHHVGDHDERGTPARSACRKVIRYEERAAEEACRAVEPYCACSSPGCDICHPPATASPPGPTCSPDCACRTHAADRGCAGCHPDRYHDGEGYVPCAAHFPNPPPVRPAPVPRTQDLIAAVLFVEGRRDGLLLAVREARDALDREERRLGDVQPDLEGACSALAKHVGAGKLVLIGGATFKAIAPRKPKGGVAVTDALWRLEPVEVAK